MKLLVTPLTLYETALHWEPPKMGRPVSHGYRKVSMVEQSA